MTGAGELALPGDLPVTGAPPASRARAEVVIRPRRGLASLQLRELWRFRDLLLILAQRDVKLRYRQTALGVAWVFLQPLLGAAIFALVFGRVARLPTGSTPYFLFAFTGLVTWTVFQGTLSRAGQSLIGGAHLISKVFFPRLILPLSTVGSVLLDFVVSMGLLAVLLLLFQHPLTPAVLLLPVWLILLELLALGAGFLASALSVSYRDVVHVMPVMLQLLLYGSPVAYGLQAVPEKYRLFFLLNPLTPLLEGARWSLLGTPPPPLGFTLLSAVVCVTAFVVGTIAFKNMERKFADII